MKGVKWNNSVADYPQYIMGPTVGFMNEFNVAAFVKEQIIETGFDGVHIPLLAGWDDKVFRFLELADEKGFLIHFWLYGDRDAGTAPKNPNSDEERVWQDRLATKLRPYKNWSMGLGYDLQEWAPHTNDVGGFVHFWRVGLSMRRQFGGRYLPADRGPYPGQIISVEQQIINKDALKVQLTNILDSKRPVMSSDRFRVRSGGKKKDWSLNQIPIGISDCLELGVAAIWGYGDRVNDLGSKPWPNKEEIARVFGNITEPPPPPECEQIIDTAIRELTEISINLNSSLDKLVQYRLQ